jgi:hypothetical protein
VVNHPNRSNLRNRYLDEGETAGDVLSEIHRDLWLMLRAVNKLPPGWWNDDGSSAREHAYRVLDTTTAIQKKLEAGLAQSGDGEPVDGEAE